jgi:tRNA threonylcarbamoyladenosine biosynthesis protein TsaE
VKRVINTPEEMENLGKDLAKSCLATTSNIVFFLSGDLGAGKTTLVRGFLRELGHFGAVKSPTFTLVEPYEFAEREVYHFDLYRLKNEEELAFIGIRDYFHAKAYCLIEWPEKALDQIPSPDLQVQIEIIGEHRTVHLVAKSNRGKDVLQALQME